MRTFRAIDQEEYEQLMNGLEDYELEGDQDEIIEDEEESCPRCRNGCNWCLML